MPEASLGLPQLLYLSAVALYLLFFGLFLRFLGWKRYADRLRQRLHPPLSLAGLQESARNRGRTLPVFSILVPARNESEVIEGTIDHLARLDYPPNRFEVIIITDEKEALAARQQRKSAREGAVGYLQSAAAARPLPVAGVGPLNTPATENPAALVLGLCCQLAADEGQAITHDAPPNSAGALPREVAIRLAWEAALGLWEGRTAAVHQRLLLPIRRRLAAESHVPEQAAGAEAHVLTTLVTWAGASALALAIDSPERARRVRRAIARAVSMCGTHPATVREESVHHLACSVRQRLLTLTGGRAVDLENALSDAQQTILPTTQDIVRRKVSQFQDAAEMPRLVHTQVPRDFDGRSGGQCAGRSVPSTKGRALNWGLAFLDRATEWCGFYDAESRPDARVLLYVARRWLADTTPGALPPNADRSQRPLAVGGDRPVRIFQGPVFQVRNFYQMGAFCKIASLYQAVAHDWYLPVLFHCLPFVGGTNLFVETRLLRQIGGFDHAALTEDLELGTRAFLETSAWPEYLPLASSEQTPPSFGAFFRQRLRWASGHLQVMDKIRNAHQYPAEPRLRLLSQLHRKGQSEWVFYQGATLLPPVLLGLWWFGLIDPTVLSGGARLALNLLSLVYLGFTLYVYRRYSEHLDTASIRTQRLAGQVMALAQLLVLPLAAFLFPVPYSSALFLSAVGRRPGTWVKTPRTRE